MTSKERIHRVIERDAPGRVGYAFNEPHPSDTLSVHPVRLLPLEGGKFEAWGNYPELNARVPFFTGETRLDAQGSIFGRFEGKTNGECILGVLEEDFGLVERFEFQPFDPAYDAALDARLAPFRDRYLLGALPVSIFSTLRDMRKMDNALVDTLENPGMVSALLDKVCEAAEKAIGAAKTHGFDAVIMYDDWGTQIATFISPKTFRLLFAPAYKRVAAHAHKLGLQFMLHSCGCIEKIIGDLCDSGVDVFQLDQPELTGVERFARDFGGRASLFSPVDIQMVMKTGDRKLIEGSARRMLEAFRPLGGGLIAKDYPSWGDINISDEWAGWARNVFIQEGAL